MSSADLQERPAKKRRFFVEDPPEETDQSLNSEKTLPDEIPGEALNAEPEQTENEGDVAEPAVGFDSELFTNIVGETLDENSLRIIREQSNNDLQRGGLQIALTRNSDEANVVN